MTVKDTGPNIVAQCYMKKGPTEVVISYGREAKEGETFYQQLEAARVMSRMVSECPVMYEALEGVMEHLKTRFDSNELGIKDCEHIRTIRSILHRIKGEESTAKRSVKEIIIE